MKKTFLLVAFALTACAAGAQVGIDSATDPAAPVAAPPPPPPPPAPAYIPPATTTTTTSSTTTATTPVTPVYNARRGSIDVNRLRFGAYIAPTISWMHPTAATDDKNEFNVESNGSRVGFTFGLMAEYFFAPRYGIVTGLQINQTGGKIIATNKDQTLTGDKVLKADFTYRLQYFEIPLALKLRTDDINGFKFFGQLGVSLGVNTAKKADYKVTSTTGGAKRDTSADNIKLTGSLGLIAPVMFQMNLGVGAEYPFSNSLTGYFGLFFNNGFAPDATNPDKFDNGKLGYSGTFRDANTRLNNFAIRLGLFF